MNGRIFSVATFCFGAGWLFAGSTGWAAPRFVKDVQPIFMEHCVECHGGVKKKGGISFVAKEWAFQKGESGHPAIAPGDWKGSELALRVQSQDEDERMPPKKPLTSEEIAILQEWIQSGAEWSTLWSLEPVKKVEASDPGHEIDGFIRKHLEANGLKPSPEADRATLIRRLSLDLTGLLPTPDEVDAFQKDTSSDAYEKVVDRLLASPHFGERWGRHWLDEARYADSAGYEKDSARADSYRFRDWVISAINDDMPFDQFSIRQIAGDLLPNATRQDREATAFQLMTQFNLEGGVDAEEDRTKRVIDRVNTVGSVWMGISVGCSQCHDHPYDPFTQKEFYQLYAFFDNVDWTGIFVDDFPPDAEKRIIERHEKWTEIKDVIDRQVTEKNLATKLQGLLSRFRGEDNAWGFTRVVVERDANRRKTYLFERGNFLTPDVKAGPVSPGTPAVMPPLKPRPRFASQTAAEKKEKAPQKPLPPDRLDLANWLTDPAHPTVARVTVNKVWQHLFGEGICDRPDDFGSKGDSPSHPELLDWLARYFVEDTHWSRKKLIRKIVTSATYRQSSTARPEVAERDPGNRLLARQNRTRVEGEIIRDLYLQAGGLLSPKVGGPSVFPPIPDDVASLSYANNFQWKESTGEDRYRRGMYTFYKRTAPDPNLVMFDCPDASVTNQKRNVSNTPLQALATLQNQVFLEAARSMARNLLAGGEKEAAARLAKAFSLTLNRKPDAEEIKTLTQLLQESRQWYGSHPEASKELIGKDSDGKEKQDELAAWIIACRVLLNTDEFITRS